MDRLAVWLVVACLAAPGAALAETSTAPETARAQVRPVVAAARIFRRDLRQFLSPRTVVIVGAGGVLARVAVAREDPQAIVHDLSGSTWEGAANVGNAWGNGALAVGLAGTLLVAGHASGDSTMFGTGFQLARAFAYTGALVEGLKVMVDRTRPDGGKYSFPSGHAAIASSMVPVLARGYGLKAGVPAAVLAALTSVGRLEDRRHYLSDVLFGSALGLSVGLAVSDREPGHELALALTGRGAALTMRF